MVYEGCIMKKLFKAAVSQDHAIKFSILGEGLAPSTEIALTSHGHASQLAANKYLEIKDAEAWVMGQTSALRSRYNYNLLHQFLTDAPQQLQAWFHDIRHCSSS
jgi:hypothetical protein